MSLPFHVHQLDAHTLKSYPGFPALRGVEVLASFAISTQGLRILFQFKDANSLLATKLPQAAPVLWDRDAFLRKDELWKETCFEVFWAKPNEKQYWELNLSGGAEWNLYQFKDYRQPQPPQVSHTWVLESLKTSPQGLEAFLASTEAMPATELEVNFCAILKTTEGETAYYSTKHSADRPDFHKRSSLSRRYAVQSSGSPT